MSVLIEEVGKKISIEDMFLFLLYISLFLSSLILLFDSPKLHVAFISKSLFIGIIKLSVSFFISFFGEVKNTLFISSAFNSSFTSFSISFFISFFIWFFNKFFFSFFFEIGRNSFVFILFLIIFFSLRFFENVLLLIIELLLLVLIVVVLKTLEFEKFK